MNFRIFVDVLFVPIFLLAILFVDRSPRETFAFESAGVVTRPTPVPGTSKPAFTDYKGITLGMSAVDARAKLPKPKETSDQQDFYIISAGESVQILYGDDKNVKAISTTYFGSDAKPPTPIAVFGTDVEVQPNGSINKMVKYPKLGFWISYIRTEGDDPVIMVTIHKLQEGEQ